MNGRELNHVASLAEGDRPATPLGWIQSARFDLTFFILSPLIALPVLIHAPAGPSVVALVAGCALGVPHYLSTFTFFFWEDTRAQHRLRWAVFFGGPVLVVASLACAVILRVPFIVQVVVYTWNAFHVARQSCGILSIYRHRAGVQDPIVKPIVNGAVMSTSLALAFSNVQWFPALHEFMTIVWTPLPRAIFFGMTIVAIACLARLAVSLVRRFRSSDRPNYPELLFLATSLLLFHPYLWIHDADRATLGMLLGHFLQYLGIVWLVHRRKFTEASDQTSRGWLPSLSRSLPVLLIVLAAIGGGSAAARLLSFRVPTLQALYGAALLSLSLVHFYLDGVFWAFRRPDVRRSLGPYLTGFRARAVVGSAG